MFGISLDKIIIIGFVAVLIVGPTRLPAYAAKLAQLVKGAKAFAESAKDRLNEELGPDFEEVDWKKLDPRQYDPRRIIASALLDDDAELLPSPIRRVGSRHAPAPDASAAVDPEPLVEAVNERQGEKIAGGTAE